MLSVSVILKLAAALTLSESVAVLFAVAGSLAPAGGATVAVFVSVPLALAEIELAALERGGIGWRVERGLGLEVHGARELLEELRSSFADRLVQSLVEVGEVQERRRGRELLPLEQHRR